MAFNVKTIVKLFMIFFFFQLSLSTILTILPIINNDPTPEDSEYILFLTTKTNFLGINTGTLLTDFVEAMPSEGTFNDTLLNTFLGIYKIVSASIKFLVELGISILVTPNIMMSILLYNFVGNTIFLTSASVIVNIGFYGFIYYIVFKEGVK